MKTKILSVVTALAIAMTSFVALTITASAEVYSFSYAYDCQRAPSFPSKGDTCVAYDFTYPLISYRVKGNTNSGSWTLTYIGDYKDNSSVSEIISQVATNVKSSYNLATTDNIPVYELKDGNTHIAYGVLCAIAENNEEAMFIGDTWPNGGGYVLSNVELSGSKTITIIKDITDIEYEHEVAAEISIDDVDAYIDNQGFGHLRVISKVLFDGKDAEYFGAWFIPADLQNDDTYEKAQVTVSAEIESGDTFASDLRNIPAESLGRNILVIPFIKLVGEENLATTVREINALDHLNETSR